MRGHFLHYSTRLCLHHSRDKVLVVKWRASLTLTMHINCTLSPHSPGCCGQATAPYGRVQMEEFEQAEEECSRLHDPHQVRLRVIYCGSIREYARRNSHEIQHAPRATLTPRRRWILVWRGPRPHGDVLLRHHQPRRSALPTPLIRNSAYVLSGMFSSNLSPSSPSYMVVLHRNNSVTLSIILKVILRTHTQYHAGVQ